MSKPAARIDDTHDCPMAGHVGGPIITSGAPTVIIAGKPAGTVTSKCRCKGPDDTVTKGSGTVLLSGLGAARIDDTTKHKGKITSGAANVLIGG